jgi:4-amino-4-deoxy-L-arabinose transferase-like glycosyltransferase
MSDSIFLSWKSSMRRFELPVVIVLAAALRLLVLFLWSPQLSADALDYDRLARSLVEGRGYVNAMGEPTSWRPPLYPAFVAVGYVLTGGSIQGVRILQAALDLGTVACTYVIGRLAFGRNPGLVAALLVTVNLGTVAATGRLMSETLFTFFLVAGVTVSVVWFRAIKDSRIKAAIALGVGAGSLLGAATLTRGILLLYPISLVVLVVLSLRVSESTSVEARSVSERRRAAFLGCLTLVLTFVLILVPWTLRNYWVHRAFIPVATQLGGTLYASYNPPKGWLFGIAPEDPIIAAAERLREPEANAVLARAAVDSIRASPVRALKLEILKTLYFWAPFDWEILPFYGAFNPSYTFIALWAVIYLGFCFRWESFLATGAVWLPIFFLFGMALVFYGSPRFRLPAEPLLAVFAAVPLVALDRRVGRRTWAAMVGGTVVFLLLVYAFAGPLKHFARERIFAPEKSSDLINFEESRMASFCFGTTTRGLAHFS